jgi:hypothetical protein
LTDSGEKLSDSDRGETSREGWDSEKSEVPIKDSRQRPDLSDPAEEEMNPPTHPSRTGGLGPATETERANDASVPQGNPMGEGDNIDNQ